MQEYFLIQANFEELVKRLLSSAKVIAPVEYSRRNILQEITLETIKDINLRGFRSVESFKSYLFKLTEVVSTYFGQDEPTHQSKLVFLGARGCDLEALEVLEKVLAEGEFADPYYIANRSDVLIIGADCTDCGKTCFCAMVEGKPYPTKLFDLTLSPLEDGYAVEVGSEKGQKIVDGNPELFSNISEKADQNKKENREKIVSLLDEKNKDYHLKLKLSAIHKANLENKVWQTLTKDCVECSACNFACPTCTCFLLLDTEHSRHKVWDGCLKAGYARVAGGANARGKLSERLQNRYHCKFDYSFDRLNRYTCVGCGRCIDGCAGNIDMRKIFIELEKQAPFTAKLV